MHICASRLYLCAHGLFYLCGILLICLSWANKWYKIFLVHKSEIMDEVTFMSILYICSPMGLTEEGINWEQLMGSLLWLSTLPAWLISLARQGKSVTSKPLKRWSLTQPLNKEKKLVVGLPSPCLNFMVQFQEWLKQPIIGLSL